MLISIIVCTYNRPDAIGNCLNSIHKSLEHSSQPEVEIVVVNNASTDHTASILEEWAKTCQFPIKIVLEEKQGIAAARNCGIRAANGKLLVFIDDDCCMQEDHIENVANHYLKDKEPIFRGGRVELGDSSDLPLTIQTHKSIIRWHKTHKVRTHLGGGVIPGCNMIIPLDIIDEIGFFDECMGAGAPIPAGEDSDFIIRAYLAGFLIEYVPDVVVKHFHGRKTIKEGVKLIRNYTLGSGALYGKFLFTHPNLRIPTLYKKVPTINNSATAKRKDPLKEIKCSFWKKALYGLQGALMYYRYRNAKKRL
ncbi:MAG: glycosyl transferase [Micavibrio sp.]|nr:MAG: glycosyl transferase [Micavibrio sp.]